MKGNPKRLKRKKALGGRPSDGFMAGIRSRIEQVELSADDTSISPHDVMDDDQETIAEKVELARYRRGVVKKALDRFRRCRTAQDVFADFALDAAQSTVLEMVLAQNSSDRQRASEHILNRAMGKPVDRVMSIAMKVSAKSDPELEHDISNLLAELGYQGGERKAREILAGGEGAQGPEQAIELQAESRVEWRDGVPRKVYSIEGEG